MIIALAPQYMISWSYNKKVFSFWIPLVMLSPFDSAQGDVLQRVMVSGVEPWLDKENTFIIPDSLISLFNYDACGVKAIIIKIYFLSNLKIPTLNTTY